MRILRLLVTLSIVVGSLLPGGAAALRELRLLHINDKVEHFGAYLLLGWLAAWMQSRTAPWISFLRLVGLGVLLEVLQIFVPGRSCELADALADSGGVLLGLILGACMASLWGMLRREVPVGCGELDGEVQQAAQR
jgi:VanZ family protein